MIVSRSSPNSGDLARAGMQLMFLKFGRNDEQQADDLGLRYMTRAGLRPARRWSRCSRCWTGWGRRADEGACPRGSPRTPHPPTGPSASSPQIRAQNLAGTRRRGGQTISSAWTAWCSERTRARGFFEAARFYHPELRFQLHFPAGWKTQNQKQAVGAISPQEDAIVVADAGPGTSAEQAAQRVHARRRGCVRRARSGLIAPRSSRGDGPLRGHGRPDADRGAASPS